VKEGKRMADQLPAVHEHRFEASNPFQREVDRCECGMFRYEIMGPIERAKARTRQYGHRWPAFPR
jgi:hypothetical protein